MGRYQLTPGALQDAGWKNADGTWSDKAKQAGVKSDDDFLNNPEAQEKALDDVLARNEAQLKAFGAWDAIGKTFIGNDGKPIAITMFGLLLAAHKEGAKGVHDFFQFVDSHDGSTHGQRLDGHQNNIERRLRAESEP